MKLRNRIVNILVLTLVNSAAVYAVYTPYVILWLGMSRDQYWKWLVGGLPMSLAFGWVFAKIGARTETWLNRRRQG